MNKESPLYTWRTGRGYHRYTYNKRMEKFVPGIMAAEFIFFTGAYFGIRYSSFFGDDTFQAWDYPAGLVVGMLGMALFTSLVNLLVNVSQGQEMKLFPTRLETEIGIGDNESITMTTHFSDVLSAKVTEIKQNPNSFLLIDLELKPGTENVLSREAPIHQFGIPQEVDAAPILQVFEQNHVPLSRH